MKKMITKIKKFINTVINFKPQVIEFLTIIYKAIYVLDAVLKVSIEIAEKTNLDASGLEKIAKYVNKILVKIDKYAAKLKINIKDTEFAEEISEIIENVPVPRNRKTLTLANVVERYSKVFDKLNDELD